ncbi:MAG: hypothetical protein ABH821_04835 [archaeon]
MLSNENKIIIGFAVIGLLVFVFSMAFIQPTTNNNTIVLQNSEQNFQEFSNAELSDKCLTPEGYTDELWLQHMSHHPDRYEGCL